MECYSKDDCLPCSLIFLEGFDELFHFFDELFHAFLSIFLEEYGKLFHGFNELFHALLLFLLNLDTLKPNCFDKRQVLKNIIST